MEYIGGIGTRSCVVGGEKPCDSLASKAHTVRLRPKSGEQSCSVTALSLLVVHDRFDVEVRDACSVVDIVGVVHTMNRSSIWNNKLVNLHTRTVQPLEVQICANMFVLSDIIQLETHPTLIKAIKAIVKLSKKPTFCIVCISP